MGILSTAGKVALGLAADHLKERGVKGTVEDLGKAASSVKGFFSSDDYSDDSSDNNPLVEFYELINDGKYDDAVDYLDDLYTNGGFGEIDTWYYCLKAEAVIECYRSRYYNPEELKEIEGFISELVTEADNLICDSRDRKLVLETRKLFNEARSQNREKNKYMEKLIKFNDQFNDIVYQNPDEAQRLLDEYYSNNEDEKNFWYYQKRNEVLWSKSYDCTELNLQKQKALIEDNIREYKENLKLMKNMDGDHEEALSEQNVYLADLEILLIRTKCAILTDNKCFDEARNTVEKIKNIANNDESRKEYYQILSRIESLRLLNAVEKRTTNTQAIKDMIETSEKFKSLAVSYESDADIIAKIESAIDERIDKAKKYLASLGSSANKTSYSPKVNDTEAEYITELKDCLNGDGKITDRERRLLDRLRKSLGISETRAKELEAQLSQPSLTDDEKEYADELKACMEDGSISDRERRLLNKLRVSLGISEKRAKEIEAMI